MAERPPLRTSPDEVYGPIRATLPRCARASWVLWAIVGLELAVALTAWLGGA